MSVNIVITQLSFLHKFGQGKFEEAGKDFKNVSELLEVYVGKHPKSDSINGK